MTDSGGRQAPAPDAADTAGGVAADAVASSSEAQFVSPIRAPDQRTQRASELEEIRRKQLAKSMREQHKGAGETGGLTNLDAWQTRQRQMAAENRRKQMEASASLRTYRCSADDAVKQRAAREEERRRRMDATETLHKFRGTEHVAVPAGRDPAAARARAAAEAVTPDARAGERRAEDPAFAEGSVRAKAAEFSGGVSPDEERVGSQGADFVEERKASDGAGAAASEGAATVPEASDGAGADFAAAEPVVEATVSVAENVAALADVAKTAADVAGAAVPEEAAAAVPGVPSDAGADVAAPAFTAEEPVAEGAVPISNGVSSTVADESPNIPEASNSAGFGVAPPAAAADDRVVAVPVAESRDDSAAATKDSGGPVPAPEIVEEKKVESLPEVAPRNSKPEEIESSAAVPGAASRSSSRASMTRLDIDFSFGLITKRERAPRTGVRGAADKELRSSVGRFMSAAEAVVENLLARREEERRGKTSTDGSEVQDVVYDPDFPPHVLEIVDDVSYAPPANHYGHSVRRFVRAAVPIFARIGDAELAQGIRRDVIDALRFAVVDGTFVEAAHGATTSSGAFPAARES